MILSALHTPGDVIASRYRIVALLGKGGMGETYEVEDLESYQRVALKVLSLRQMTEWKTLDLFEREAKVLSQLDHPQIPNYLDSFDLDITNNPDIVERREVQELAGQSQEQLRPLGQEGDRHFYIVRELVSGESLSDRITKGWRPQENDLRDVATQVLHILVYLHRLSPPLIHRDIKPANIIRQPDGTIYLVDFGTVQDIYRETLLGSNTFVGTAGYMPPEQFRGQTTTVSDLYSLGATLLYLATQQTPDQLPQSRMMIDVAACTDLSTPFTQWLTRLVEPIAEDRFTSAAVALNQLPGSQPRSSKALMQSPTASHSASWNRTPASRVPIPRVLKPASALASRQPAGAISKPIDAKALVSKSPQHFQVEVPLRPRRVRQSINLLDWIINPEKSLSVGDWIVKKVVSIVAPMSLPPNSSGHSQKLNLGTYVMLGVGALFLLPLLAGVLTVLLSMIAIIFFNIVLNPFVLIAGAFFGVRSLRKHRAEADTFILDITPQSYHFRYLKQGEVMYDDGGDSQQLEIVLGDRYRGYRSSALGCVLVDRAAKQYASHTFGHNLSVEEQDWLVYEIKSFLRSNLGYSDCF